jgi:hypothetical protein
MLPFFFAIRANNPERRFLEARRQQLAGQFASHSFEILKEAALEVFKAKKLRGVADEAEFLTEVDTWHPYHLSAAQLLNRF